MDLDFYQALTDAGVKPEQARDAVNAIHREIEKETRLTMAEYVQRTELHAELDDLATKSDLKAVKSELQTEIQTVKSELRVEIEKLKTMMIQWFVGSSISIVALVIAAAKFLH